MKCKECNKDLWAKEYHSKKFLESGLCFGCFKISRAEEDTQLEEHLNMRKEKSNRVIRRMEFGWEEK